MEDQLIKLEQSTCWTHCCFTFDFLCLSDPQLFCSCNILDFCFLFISFETIEGTSIAVREPKLMTSLSAPLESSGNNCQGQRRAPLCSMLLRFQTPGKVTFAGTLHFNPSTALTLLITLQQWSMICCSFHPCFPALNLFFRVGSIHAYTFTY